MTEGLYVGLLAASFVAGLLIAPWRFATLVPPVAWVLGVAIAALAGAFAPTSEDNSLGVFLFTAVPALAWVLFAVAGVLVRRLAHDRRLRARVDR